MKLLTYDTGQGPQAGVVVDGQILDVATVLGEPGGLRDIRALLELQRDEMQARLGPAKGKDAATSLGPWLVTTDELAPFFRDGRLHVRCSLTVNGVTWMEGDGGRRSPLPL